MHFCDLLYLTRFVSAIIIDESKLSCANYCYFIKIRDYAMLVSKNTCISAPFIFLGLLFIIQFPFTWFIPTWIDHRFGALLHFYGFLHQIDIPWHKGPIQIHLNFYMLDFLYQWMLDNECGQYLTDAMVSFQTSCGATRCIAKKKSTLRTLPGRERQSF